MIIIELISRPRPSVFEKKDGTSEDEDGEDVYVLQMPAYM